jgi:hypothetical protein
MSSVAMHAVRIRGTGKGRFHLAHQHLLKAYQLYHQTVLGIISKLFVPKVKQNGFSILFDFKIRSTI